jgi:cGMP-dependent protein kinase
MYTENPLAARKASMVPGTIGGNAISKEQNLELLLKSKKRANVFNQGIGKEQRNSFHAKHIPKTKKQEQIIRSAVSENFIFASLNSNELDILVNAMSIIKVEAMQNVITEGKEGDYYYIIEQGEMTVYVGGREVGILNTGKGFGELALLHNTPRAATIRANTTSSLFALDRTTFRFVIAQTQSQAHDAILDALKRVPLFEELTEVQLQKICDAVEIVPYAADSQIIKKGCIGNIFYMIKEGTVKVTDIGSKFADEYLKAGDYFGERALITGEPRAANVHAVTACTLMALDRDAFNSLLGPLSELLSHNMNMRILTSVKLFEKLNLDEKKKLSESFVVESFEADDVIVRQGDKGTTFYILKEGNTKVVIGDQVMGQLQAGSYFGEMALLNDEVRAASVIATERSICFSIDRDMFNSILGSLKDIIERDTASRITTIKKSNENYDVSTIDTSILLKDLETIGALGSGTFGRVYLVQHKETKNVYALKTMFKSEIVAQKQQMNVINEKNVMLQCAHPFILKLYQTFKDPRKLFMLLEFVQGGELFSVIHTNTSDGVPDLQAKFYAVGVILAIAHLHNKEIAYRDMKPENCLIDKEGYPKVVDFGFAKSIQGKSFTLCGTPEYLAPELVLGRGHNKAVDYWAFGILIYEMIAGYSPFSDPAGMDQVVICRNIVNGRVVFPRNFNADAKDIVKKLLSREVQSRLGNLKAGTDDIIQHSWFNSIDFDQYFSKQMAAPWVPQVKSATDTSAFDSAMPEDNNDFNFIDTGMWDRDF